MCSAELVVCESQFSAFTQEVLVNNIYIYIFKNNNDNLFLLMKSCLCEWDMYCLVGYISSSLNFCKNRANYFG